MIRLIAAVAVGILFGAGLTASGMTDPRIVLGFLDVAGRWDPRLLLVMAGAVAVGSLGFWAVPRRARPLFAAQFKLSTPHGLDRQLVGGAALFGIGWGIAGYCPGPALASVVINPNEALVFLPAMLLGSWAARRLTRAA